MLVLTRRIGEQTSSIKVKSKLRFYLFVMGIKNAGLKSEGLTY